MNEITLERIKLIAKDIKEDDEWVNDSHTRATHIGVCDGLDRLIKHLEETQEDDPHIACFSYPNCDEAPLGCIAVMGSDVEPYGNKD